MKLAAIKKFCASLPYAKGEIKWDVDLVYSIGGRMFCVACTDKTGKEVVCFKVDDDRFLEMTDREGFMPAPYLARAKWVQISDLSKIRDAEMKSLIQNSYYLVAAKLSRKLQRELGIQTG